MTELKFPPRPNLRPYNLSREFMKYPGRNHPDIGKWLVETYTKPGDWIVDPMCGVGQMWLITPRNRPIAFSDHCNDAHDIMLSRAAVGITMQFSSAETVRPWPFIRRQHIGLVAFSPPYPQSHNAGATEHQIKMRDEKGDHAIQGFEGLPPDMPRVYANIASWGHPTLAVVLRNKIELGKETCWVEQNAAMIHAAGYTHLEEFWRFVYPTRWQQAKLKRDPTTPVIDREWILVATK